MARLAGTLSRLAPMRALVIGDLILDRYTIGRAQRISPEAPVAVVNVTSEEFRVGGAGNVMLNMLSIGCSVIAVGRVGDDQNGIQLANLLVKEGVRTEGLFSQSHYRTPVKNRIISDGQQVVRVDFEKIEPLEELLEQRIVEELPSLLEGIGVVAISDYGKGFLSTSLLAALIESANAMQIPIIADPKGVDFAKYSGATLLKPNETEAYDAANLTRDFSLTQVAAKLFSMGKFEALMITRSEAGISLFSSDGTHCDYPVAVQQQVKDVTGAGDTVLAVVACALANRLSLSEAAQLGNVAAGIAIQHFGCAQVTLSDLSRALLQLDGCNKLFDTEHLFALQQALRGRKVAINEVNSHKGLSQALLNHFASLSKEGVCVVVCLQEREPSEELISLLMALRYIDFILLSPPGEKVTLEEVPDVIHFSFS